MRKIETSRWFPVINLSLLDQGELARDRLVAQLDWACREFGFFHLVGHGIDEPCIAALTALSERRQIFHTAAGGHEAALASLGQRLQRTIAESACIEGDPLAAHRISNAVHFRIPHHPVKQYSVQDDESGDGLGQGLLTLLKQSSGANLEVRYARRWIAVPEVSNALVCIVGDALQNLTDGQYVSVAHRCGAFPDRSLSMTLVVAPDFDAEVIPFAGAQVTQCRSAEAKRFAA